MRYLEWTFDPDPSDSTCVVEYAYVLHEAGRPTRTVLERHEEGLFVRADWLRLLEEVGFKPARLSFQHSEVARPLDVFVGVRSR